ncbi:MAG: lytic transglycosylase domain-containing protein [Bacteroidetes bacterium]|nr:lytic transglycosylase domain-containing protein [Bacteroidota bacterium]MBS1757653.1 lytic transglycosylase domain-containing protein [Bacteroidota bacterium]
MKNTFLNSLLLSVCTIVIAGTAKAYSPADTTNNNLLACIDNIPKKEIVIKEANVLYPSIFAGAENESMEYIEKLSENRKAYLTRIYKLSKKYFPKVAPILKKQNIPAEFAVLMALESGFNSNAVSSAGAVGYWQIMDDVAKEYGLKIAAKEKTKEVEKVKPHTNKQKAITDERKNFVRSTHAAARYLKDRSRNLNGNWLLIAASYNCGVGNVWDAMEKCGKSNPDFWDIKDYLPAETRAYVMNFIALNVIFKNFDNFSKNNLCFKPVLVNYTPQQMNTAATLQQTD